jgi:hypothetical protein
MIPLLTTGGAIVGMDDGEDEGERVTVGHSVRSREVYLVGRMVGVSVGECVG